VLENRRKLYLRSRYLFNNVFFIIYMFVILNLEFSRFDQAQKQILNLISFYNIDSNIDSFNRTNDEFLSSDLSIDEIDEHLTYLLTKLSMN
jgi:hypothetical protein